MPSAAFKDIPHIELAADLTNINGAASIDEARVASDHQKPAKARQFGKHLFGQRIAEESLRRVAERIRERQDSNGRQLPSNQGRLRRGVPVYPGITNKAKSPARIGLDEPLLPPVVAQQPAQD